MRVRAAILLLGVVSAGCDDGPTTLRVRIEGVAVTQLSIDVKLGTGAQVSRALTPPGDALVVLPDVVTTMDVTLAAVGNQGAVLTAEGRTTSQPHQQLEMSLTPGSGLLDGGVFPDGILPDLGGGPTDLPPPLVPTMLTLVAGL